MLEEHTHGANSVIRFQMNFNVLGNIKIEDMNLTTNNTATFMSVAFALQMSSELICELIMFTRWAFASQVEEVLVRGC